MLTFYHIIKITKTIWQIYKIGIYIYVNKKYVNSTDLNTYFCWNNFFAHIFSYTEYVNIVIYLKM